MTIEPFAYLGRWVDARHERYTDCTRWIGAMFGEEAQEEAEREHMNRRLRRYARAKAYSWGTR